MTTMHLGTCHQNSRALTCFMSLATVTLAQNKAAEVKAALAQNQAKIRSCQQQARRQAKSLLQGGLSCAAVRRVLAVYAVSEWDLGLAVQAAQRLSSLATSDARFPTSESVRTLFTEHDLDDLLQLFDDGHALWVPARKFASQFLREHDMFRWIKHLNLSQGVAPSAAEVYDFHESKLFGCTPCGQPRKRTVNKFVARFRARWAVRRGRLRATDAVDPDLLRQKAVPLFGLQGLFLFPFLGLEMRRFCLADPFSGPENGLFFGPRNYTKIWQVASFWRSASYLANKFSHQDIVWINVDETCVACSPACPTGCVVGAHCWKTHPANAHMRVKKDTSRKTFTYVAMIASRPCIQAALPHFLVCSESRMPKLVARAFKALPPSRLQLLRGKSSWVTAETFVTILTELQKALQPWLPAVKPILLLDCACPHLPKKVLSFAQKKGLQLLFVPSCGTSLLQPLDIFAFAAFKIYLRRKYQEHRRTALDGHPDLLAWVWQLGQAGQDFFGKRKWAHAFAGVGCGGDVSQLHSSLKNFMGNPVSFPLPAKPTDAELALIWPKRRKMSYAAAYLF